MDVKRFRKKYGMDSAAVIDVVKNAYPKFCKATLSMVSNDDYGVKLVPGAEKLLKSAVPYKKPNRKKGHQLTVRVGAFLYADIMEECAFRKMTVQDFLEKLLKLYFEEP